MKNLPKPKKAYNRSFRNIPELHGKITVKFAIRETGEVVYSEILPEKTTTGNPDLEKEFTDIIIQWQFGKIDKPEDVTEVVYPFVLSRRQKITRSRYKSVGFYRIIMYTFYTREGSR
jgi:hypothetical protein